MAYQASSAARVRIRPIQSDDRDELSIFYARLSPESRHARFQAGGRGISDEAASLLCGLDHEHREGFVAMPMGPDDGFAKIIGHICLEPAVSGLEMAVAVADTWQGQGVGRALLLAAVDWAKAHGVPRLHASVASTNCAVLGLIASIGRPVRESTPSAGVILVTIHLGAPLPAAA